MIPIAIQNEIFISSKKAKAIILKQTFTLMQVKVDKKIMGNTNNK